MSFRTSSHPVFAEGRTVLRRGRESVLLALFALILSTPTPACADQILTLRSGNGSIGEPDSTVRVYSFDRRGDIVPTDADFLAARAGRHAPIVQSRPWYSGIDRDPRAKWVAPYANRAPLSALYAVPFEVNDRVIVSAELDLAYSIDNALTGIYLNGFDIAPGFSDGDHRGEFRHLIPDVSEHIVPGQTNWLYFNHSDYGVIAGFLFSARIRIVGETETDPTVRPGSGGNDGQVSITILGTAFDPDPANPPSVTLVADGLPVISATDVRVTDRGRISAVLPLHDAVPAVYDVIVEQAGRNPVLMTGGFTIDDAGGADLCVEILGNSVYRVGRATRITIVVCNDGSNDAIGVPIWIGGIPSNTPISSPTGVYHPQNGRQPLVPSFENAGNPMTPIIVNRIPAGGREEFEFELTTFETELEITATVGRPMTQSVDENGFISNLLTSQDARCMREIFIGVYGTLPIPDVYNCVIESMAAAASLIPDEDGNVSWFSWIWSAAQASVACGLEETFNEAFEKFVDITGNAPGIYTECIDPLLIQPFFSDGVGSFDPNEKYGPAGFGEPGYVAAGEVMAYTIEFENLETASAAAQEVFISDFPDTQAFDLSTFELGKVSFGEDKEITPPDGASSWTGLIDLRPDQDLIVEISASLDSDTGEAAWTFRSLDPTTGELTDDPFAGFLPPNVSSPEGEGRVTFSIRTYDDLPSQTAIENLATIVFDVNEPIVTGMTRNTIDNDTPTSALDELPTELTCPFFDLDWTADDATSGAHSVRIYVTKNNGPLTIWEDAHSSPVLFDGSVGSTYGFVVAARDNVGIRENTVFNPDSPLVSIVLGICCGDGIAEGTEQCDDGHRGRWQPGSACDESCQDVACGDPTADGAHRASDALFILRTAIGIEACDPCVCDVDGSGGTQAVSASDALAVLVQAVSGSAPLNCPVCEG